MAWCGDHRNRYFIFLRVWWLPSLQNLGTNSSIMRTVGSGVFSAIFNCGLGSLHKSHICIGPSFLAVYGELHHTKSNKRVVLASCRNAFTMFVFGASKSRTRIDIENEVPAIIYICSFVVSVILQEMTWTGNRLKVFFLLLEVFYGYSQCGDPHSSQSMHNIMYLLSVTIGVANALMTVNALS
ncbi:hypothetical protein IFM89_015774 [Coptis chinensis]|uniref:Uncharacterized protein n=1 Tax=Coptis chinensis TaxID=261450 RepID=A0A835H3I0_9MAGN|nr:hypothetical protein IFM89_015774 [Coptis chinensis]